MAQRQSFLGTVCKQMHGVYTIMNSDHNPVVVKINMKLKRTNARKRSEQLELNLLKEETNKNKYNVEV